MNTNRLESRPASYGQLITLPNRDLGGATKFGWILVMLGIVISLFMLAWVAGPAIIGIGLVLKGQWFGYLIVAFGMLGLSGLCISIKLLAGGVAIVRNRLGCEIQFTDTQIISREKFGWFSHKFKFDRSKIESLFLRPLLVGEVEGEARKSAFIQRIIDLLPSDLFGVATQVRKGKLIAAGYPSETLVPLVDLIKEELDQNRVGLVSINRPSDVETASPTFQQPVAIVRQTAEEVKSAPIELPADSSLELVEQPDATVYRIPEKGIWNGSHGLMIIGVGWIVFLALFTAGMLFGDGEVKTELWIFVAVMGLFWAIGIGLVIGAIYLGRQSALIGVRDGLLFIERKTIFGTKWTDFEPGKIASLHIGAGNITVNDRPVMELKIQPVGEKAIGMFSQLEDGEIRWLAQQLRQSLTLTPDDDKPCLPEIDSNGMPVAPADSRVTVHQTPHETVIQVPSIGIRSSLGNILFFTLMTTCSYPIAIWMHSQFGANAIVFFAAKCVMVVGILPLIALTFYVTRRFTLTASSNDLSIVRRGIFGSRLQKIAQRQIGDIGVETNGLQVNDRLHWHLAVHAKDRAKTVKAMSGRDKQEIAYVAALIRHAMGINKNSPAVQERPDCFFPTVEQFNHLTLPSDFLSS